MKLRSSGRRRIVKGEHFSGTQTERRKDFYMKKLKLIKPWHLRMQYQRALHMEQFGLAIEVCAITRRAPKVSAIKKQNRNSLSQKPQLGNPAATINYLTQALLRL